MYMSLQRTSKVLSLCLFRFSLQLTGKSSNSFCRMEEFEIKSFGDKKVVGSNDIIEIELLFEQRMLQ